MIVKSKYGIFQTKLYGLKMVKLVETLIVGFVIARYHISVPEHQGVLEGESGGMWLIVKKHCEVAL